jgi:4a-hydroxytetrahydrobiopterin dehydratase
MMSDDRIDDARLQSWLAEHPHWTPVMVAGVPALQRSITLNNFSAALHLANSIAVHAEQQNHHPQLTLSWGKLEVLWWSHDVQGISARDLRLAAQTDREVAETQRRSPV